MVTTMIFSGRETGPGFCRLRALHRFVSASRFSSPNLNQIPPLVVATPVFK